MGQVSPPGDLYTAQCTAPWQPQTTQEETDGGTPVSCSCPRGKISTYQSHLQVEKYQPGYLLYPVM